MSTYLLFNNNFKLKIIFLIKKKNAYDKVSEECVGHRHATSVEVSVLQSFCMIMKARTIKKNKFSVR